MIQNFHSAALILAWLMTPESLVLVSKVSGMSGRYSVYAVAAGFFLSLAAASIIHNQKLHRHGYLSDNMLFEGVLNKQTALTLVAVGRLPVLLFASTGMLVSAGFAFNEIYLYWFPNFLFASLLLIIIVTLNMISEDAALKMQVAAVTVTAAALITILLIAAAGPKPLAVEVSSAPEATVWVRGAALAFLPFLGIDFHRSDRGGKVVYLTLLFGVLILLCWASLLTDYVDSSHLAESAVSYMILARETAGDAGRWVMGVAVIGGVAAGVNGLFIVCRRSLAYTFCGRLGEGKGRGGWFVILVFGAAIEVMMMTGFAGEELLESQLRGALSLWLMYLGARVVAAGMTSGAGMALHKWLSLIVGMSIWAIMAYLVFIDPMQMYVIRFMAVTVTGTFLVSSVWRKLNYA